MFVLLKMSLCGGEQDALMIKSHSGGTRHGSCGRTMTRGLEMCVLDGTNTRSVADVGCESFCRGPLHWIRGWGLPMGSVLGAAHW